MIHPTFYRYIHKKKKISQYSEIAVVSDKEENLLKARDFLVDLNIPVYLFLISTFSNEKTDPSVIQIENTLKMEEYFLKDKSRIYLACF